MGYLSHNILEAQRLDIWNPSKGLNAIDVQLKIKSIIDSYIHKDL